MSTLSTNAHASNPCKMPPCPYVDYLDNLKTICPHCPCVTHLMPYAINLYPIVHNAHNVHKILVI